jgi:hypothetical protein
VKIQFRLLLLNSTVLLSCASNGTSTDAKIYPRRCTHIFVGKFLVCLASSVVLFVLFTMNKYDRNKLRISLAWWTLYRCYGCVYTQTINWMGEKRYRDPIIRAIMRKIRPLHVFDQFFLQRGKLDRSIWRTTILRKIAFFPISPPPNTQSSSHLIFSSLCVPFILSWWYAFESQLNFSFFARHFCFLTLLLADFDIFRFTTWRENV